MTKFVFVTGGVVSSIGKGIVAASLGRLLKSRQYSVSILKLDPYINVDPGTLNPYEHGECFVTEDGAKAGVSFTNTSETEPMVILRYFGPEVNPDAPKMGAYRKNKFN